MQSEKRLALLLGPILFFAITFIPLGGIERDARVAIGTVAWMAVWWVSMPINPAITAFLPVAINAVFSVTDMNSIISSYAAELVFLLAGSNIMAIAWEVTGVDKRIAALVLSLVGTSVKQQICLKWHCSYGLLGRNHRCALAVDT